MHILHIVRQYAPGIGGLEGYVAMLAKCQSRMGHQVRVLTLDRLFDGDGQCLSAAETVDGVPVERIAWRGSKRYPLAPAVVHHLGEAELVHIHGVDFFVDALAASRFVHRKPMILSTHGGFFHTGFAQRLKRIFFTTVTRGSLMGMRAIIASSVQDRDTFARLWPERTYLVENAVDTEKFRDLSIGNERIIIYFGRIAPNKEVSRLLHWFVALRAIEPGWRLIVAGRPMGISIARLTAEAEALGIDTSIEFYDTPNDVELRCLIARASVYACASSYEGFGLAAVEAVSAGLYPVLSDIPPFRRTYNRIGYGTLVDFTHEPDPHSFIANWKAFVDHRPSTHDIAALVAPFAWSRVAERIEQIIGMVTGRDTRRFGPLNVAVLSPDAALDRVIDAIDGRQPLLIGFANAHTVNTARKDPALVKALVGALLLNDGVGLALASFWLYGKSFPANLNGTDFTPMVLAALTRRTRVFLVGSAPEVAAEAGRRLAMIYSNVEIAGTQHGFFASTDEEALTARIIASGADLVLAAMGNPRQEIWASAHLQQLGIPILCVGALLDFTAGRVRRAPVFFRKTGTEWVYRLVQEPRRMARRYLTGNIAFLGHIGLQWFKGQRGGDPRRE